MLENTNIKQFYPGPILNKTLDITDFLFKDPEQVHITYTYKNEDGSLNNRELAYGTEYEVAKILPSDVTQADAALTASTGRVTLKADINIALGEKLTLYRESEIIQETQYPRTGPFPAAAHEGALDYLTMQNQEQQDQIDRTLKVPISTTDFDGVLPVPVPARALKINNSGSGFEFSKYDPDIALETTKEYMESAQTAASNALTSQIAANSSETAATQQANIATEQANIATEQATIATNKASEVVASGNEALSNIDTAKNNAITSITNQETTSKTSLIDEGATQVGLIQNEGATQIANVQSTGFYMRDDKLYYINSQGEETEFKSGGSGLELCDIGMALYVDETKGKRRYLNGQIVERNANTEAFFTRLKEITTLHPSLLCTEEEWQTAKTRSAFGQVGKFVFNYNGADIVSVRLPRVVNIQGLFDLQNLGMTIEAGLPNITGSVQNALNNVALFNQGDTSSSGSLIINARGTSANSANTGPVSGRFNDQLLLDASRSNPIYGKSTTVQPEAIQYPYFIQISTGSETENNIINEIELNNPYSLFDSKYSDHELNNLSWLKSNGQWNAKAVYPTAYDKLLKVQNGTETVAGLSVKLSTETYTDYDFVLNTADEKFRLPLKNGMEGMLVKQVPVIGDGHGLGLTFSPNGNLDRTFGSVQANGVAYCTYYSGYLSPSAQQLSTGTNVSSWDNGTGANTVMGVTTESGKSGLVADLSQSTVPEGWNLYFYVGETVQNANLIDAGRIGEQLANKVDINFNNMNPSQTAKNTIVGWCMPDYSAGIAKVWNTNISTTKNVRICYGGTSYNRVEDSIRLYINNNLIGNYILATAGFFMQWADIPAGATYKVTGGQTGTYIIEYPLKGAK